MSFTPGPRALRFAIGARAASFLGDQVAVVAIVLRVQAHGGGAGTIAVLLMANLLPIALLGGPAGQLLDRLDNRRLIAVTAGLQAGVCIALTATPALTFLVLGVALLGVGQAITGAAMQAMIPSLAGDLGLSRALARSQAAVTLAGVIAPGAGGLLVGVTGTAGPLLIDAASFGVVAVVGALLGGLRPIAPRQSGPTRLQGGWRIVAHHPVLATTLTLLGLFCLLGSIANVVEVFLVRDSLHAGAVWFGLCGSAWATGMLAGSLLTGRVSSTGGHARVLVGAAALDGLALVGMGLAPDVGWLLVASTVGGVMNGAINVANSSVLMGATPADERGRVSAVMNAVVGSTQLGAYGAAVALMSVVDARTVFVLAGVAAALAPVLTGRRLVRVARAGHASPTTAPTPVGVAA